MKKKSIRQSKNLIISLFAAFLCLAAGTVRAQAGRVTIDMQQVKMTQIMDEIEKQTKFLFIYDKNISVDRTASVQVREQPVAEALAQMLAGTDLTYEINSSNIILSKHSADAAASSSLHNVAGVVLDAHGQPIIGASVVIKGTTIGISTNVDGSFGLQIPASVKDPVLVVNYLGCEPQEIAVGSRADFRITMVESAVALDNVVVTALGIKRQEKALSYNVQQVKSEDIVTVKDANFMNALNGKVAGVQINSSAAGVGGAARVVMRGAKSLYKDNNALYVIDGIPMSNHSFGSADGGTCRPSTWPVRTSAADINPDDIESINGADRPFGRGPLRFSDAANGVVLINTKRGDRPTERSVTVTNSTTFSTAYRAAPTSRTPTAPCFRGLTRAGATNLCQHVSIAEGVLQHGDQRQQLPDRLDGQRRSTRPISRPRRPMPAGILPEQTATTATTSRPATYHHVRSRTSSYRRL